mmetsp:Transcript_44998/g.101231  ORF Transcript_44998/g.101231 Transcript_44998/m.101231 type:complete len:183 (+) Transcript_44998:45-593(+)
MANIMLHWSFPAPTGVSSCSKGIVAQGVQLRGGPPPRHQLTSGCRDSESFAQPLFRLFASLGAAAVVGSWKLHVNKSARRKQTAMLSSMSLFGDESEVPEWAVKGVQVKVIATDLEFFHVPKTQAPFDPHGLEGQVVKILDAPSITPNRPIVVRFATAAGRKFLAHFEAWEIELVSEGPSDE